MMITIDPARWGSALALSGAWLAMCLAIWRARAARRTTINSAQPDDADWLVVYASQTGSAEYLARQTAATLQTGGLSARAVCMSDLPAGALSTASRILFIASTYGEGDAPDSAARFAGDTMGSKGGPTADLSHLHYAVLALGDSNYTNYCGFGRALDGWLAAHGATPLFGRIDVDRGNAGALAEWQHHVVRLAGTSDAPDWEAPGYGDWRILERVLANPGSAGAPLYRLALVPFDAALPAWEAGDLAQVSAPGDPDHPREYSIASLPSEGRLELMVRLQRRTDGSLGAASGWLCETATQDDVIRLRVRAHGRFRLNGNMERPLIAIGNGSGLAGLRALIKARIADGHGDNWLLFGERNAAHDFLCRDELQACLASGSLARLDLAFSRDGATPRYVQHLVREQAPALCSWVEEGAAIYVCGSLQGMAGGVHEALVDVLGAEKLDALTAEGRYRRDVY